MIKNLKLILDKNDLHKIILIFFLNCIVAILELCSIGSIPLMKLNIPLRTSIILDCY